MDLNISLVARAGLLILILVLYNQRSADGEYTSTGTCAVRGLYSLLRVHVCRNTCLLQDVKFSLVGQQLTCVYNN